MEDGELVIKAESADSHADGVERTECTVLCGERWIPVPSSTISCVNGSWSQDPATLTCAESPCGYPGDPLYGRYHCYGNPATCYLMCNPGYATMDSQPMVTCTEGAWDRDPMSLVCEETVALLTGGSGMVPGGQVFPESCQTAEVFSPSDRTCSGVLSPILKVGLTSHTSHLINGEILVCGGNECGQSAQKVVSKEPLYTDTKTQQSCFKLLPDNSWAFHSQFPSYRWNHLGAIQQNRLELLAGHHTSLDPVLELSQAGWVSTRTPSLPPTVWAASIGKPCLVVTSPTTYIVTGGSSDLLSGKHLSSVLEFNSLTKEWRALPDMPLGRADHACALVRTDEGDAIMIVGGKNSKEDKYALKDAHILDLRFERWYPANSLNHGREEFELVVLGKRILVFGSSAFIDGKYVGGLERVEEYRVDDCEYRYLARCPPGIMGNWYAEYWNNTHYSEIGRRAALSVLPVPRSRFNCSRIEY